MALVFLEALAYAIDDRPFAGIANLVDGVFAGGEEQGEEFGGGALWIKDQFDPSGGDAPAQIDFDVPIFEEIFRIGAPAGAQVAVYNEDRALRIGTCVADAAAEVYGVEGSVDVAVNCNRSDRAPRGQHYGAGKLPGLPVTAGVKADLVGADRGEGQIGDEGAGEESAVHGQPFMFQRKAGCIRLICTRSAFQMYARYIRFLPFQPVQCRYYNFPSQQ